MKRLIKIAIWVVVAVAGAIITHTNPLWWLAGAAVCKLVLRLILTVALAIVLYVLFYALVIAGILWILIN